MECCWNLRVIWWVKAVVEHRTLSMALRNVWAGLISGGAAVFEVCLGLQALYE